MSNQFDDFDLDIQKSTMSIIEANNTRTLLQEGCTQTAIRCVTLPPTTCTVPPYTHMNTCANTCTCPNPTGGCGVGPSVGNNPDPAACLR